MGIFSKAKKTFNQNVNPFSSDFNEKKALFNVFTLGYYSAAENTAETAGTAGSALLDSADYEIEKEEDQDISALGNSPSKESEEEKEKQRAAALRKGAPGRSQSVLTTQSSGSGNSILGFN